MKDTTGICAHLLPLPLNLDQLCDQQNAAEMMMCFSGKKAYGFCFCSVGEACYQVRYDHGKTAMP